MSKTNVAPANIGGGVASLHVVPRGTDATQPSIPARIGKYEVESEIGAGARVRAFRAIDRQTERRVTLKLLVDATDSAFLERFRREVALAAGFTNPALAAIYEAGEQDGLPFAAMQCPGDDDIRQILNERLSLTLLQKMSMMWEIAEGAMSIVVWRIGATARVTSASS